jgi:hypothetical protein
MTTKYSELIEPIINTLNIDDIKKNIIRGRFLNEVNLYDGKITSVKKWYDFFRFTITMGSILLPALLSIGQMDPTKLPKNFDQVSYWGSWILSLTVTVSNGFLQLFSLDKNYFMYSLVSENLKTEGWQYFQLSGKYEDMPDHSSGYKIFCKSIESIKRKQIEQEYAGGKSADKKKKFDFDKNLNNNLPTQYKIKSLENNSSTPSESEPEPEPEPEVKVEPKPEVKVEPKPEVKVEPKPEVKVEPKPEVKVESEPESKLSSKKKNNQEKKKKEEKEEKEEIVE